MTDFPDRRILDLLTIDLPIIQAPMAGATTVEMVIAVSEAGGLGSLPCAMLSVEQMNAALETIRKATRRPINVNFFCHTAPTADAAKEQAWRERLAPYYAENKLDPHVAAATANRAPFDATFCEVVEKQRPEVVSLHFGLPESALLDRVKATGARVIASATTVEEATWLDARGCDAIIAMGFEAGGHRGSFLTDDMTRQVGTFALVPQVVDAVDVPVIAAGGIADARGIVAAFALGAAAVQLGTAYLFCPEAKITDAHREALTHATDDGTALTNVFSGRAARGIVNRIMREVGPMSPLAPSFPLAGGALGPLRATPNGARDFSNLWSGQAARLGRGLPAGELTKRLARETLEKLASFAIQPSR